MTQHQENLSPSWKNNRERSNRIMLSLLVWIALNLGRSTIKFILYPTALYFVFFAPKAKAASKQYLEKVLGKKPNWRYVWKHFYTFAQVSVDRLYFLSGRTQGLNIHSHGQEVVNHYANQKKGCLLLVSHLGSFDGMRAVGTRQEALPINILMDRQHNPLSMQLIDALDPALASRIIDATQPAPELALTIAKHLEAGDMIGIMADRSAPFEKTSYCDFLGEPAAFPQGPWLLAAALKVPVIFCVGLFDGGNQYHLHFELLSDQLTSSRKERQATIACNMEHYAARLEYYLKQSQFNWFNFYNFWSNETT